MNFIKPAQGVFVSGTDTEVGKTYVSCWQLRRMREAGLRLGAYKPVASGAVSMEASDAYQLWQASGTPMSLETVNPQSFDAALAPPMAAEAEGKEVDESMLIDGVAAWTEYCDFLLVEGAGGLCSPISWNLTNADLAVQIGYPLWIVASNRLGVVHQVLATVTVALARGLRVERVYLNQCVPTSDDASVNSNARLLEPFLRRLSPQTEVILVPHDVERRTFTR
jgi:dethiobiotin synthetase